MKTNFVESIINPMCDVPGAMVCVGIILLTATGTQAQNLFVSEIFTGTIDQFTPGGVQSTFASAAANGLACDSAGNLFAAAFPAIGSPQIYKYTPSGSQSTFASGLSYPYYLAFNSAGNLFVGDYDRGTIYEYTPSGAQS